MKIALIILGLFSFSLGFGQKFKLNITGDIKENYQVEIDGELQTIDYCRNFMILNVPNGAKTLRLLIVKNKVYPVSITVGTSNNKEEFYVVKYNGDGYAIEQNKIGFKFNEYNSPCLSGYRKPYVRKPIDSNLLKKSGTCKVSDSFINEVVKTLPLLKKETAQMTYLDQVLQYKCLNKSQIRSLAYRLPKDELRFEFVKKSYKICYNSSKYVELTNVFEKQEYSNKLTEFISSLNLPQ